MYQYTEAHFLPEGYFDHSSMVLVSYPIHNNGKKPFKYFAMLKAAPSFEKLVATH